MRREIFALLLFNTLLTAGLSAAWSPAPENFRAAADYSRTRHGFAVLVEQNGHVFFEDYENGSSPKEAHKIYSGTKAFWCVAAMRAASEGLLNFDELAADTLPEWRGDPRKSRITIRQLLNFTAGIDPGFHLHADDMRDRNAVALALPVVAEPGSRFIYGPGQIQIFGEILRRKLAARRGGETPFRYLQKRVLGPLGLGGVIYKKDALGNPLLATGFQLSARQWARFGETLLRDGHFSGTTPNPAFGMGIWNNSQAPGGREIDIENELDKKWWQQNWANACICRDAPRDLFVSLGSGYQRLFLIPSLDMVIVRQGLDAKFSDGDFLRLILGR